MPQNYQPLTPEQFQKAKSAGFSGQQIIANEQKRKAQVTGTPASVSQPAAQPQSLGQKIAGGAEKVAGFINQTVGKPFIDLAAIPVQLGAKALGQPDPFADKALGGVDVAPTSQPLRKAGSAIEAASYLAPVGTAAKATEKVLSPFVGKTLGKFGGNLAASGGTGYAVDVGMNLAEGKTGTEALKPGLGTGIGVALPIVPPALGAAARGAGESLGLSTGAGYGAIKEAFNAAAAGGERARAFVESLRGRTSPEAIVTEADDALRGIIRDRGNSYQGQLAKVTADNKKSFDISPVQKKLDTMLEEFNVARNPETGVLDFSRSPGLGRYKTDLQEIQDVLDNWGTKTGDRTVVGIDNLKQTLDDFRRGSADARKFDSFVTALRNSAKDIIKDEPGYSKLVGDYAEKTALIKDIQRALSLGDKASVDTGFRKLTTALRTNNEFRKELIDELDQASGGYLSSRIAGQQLSEMLPRGLARQIEGFGAAGAVMSGVGIVPILKFAAFASPRVVGEIVNALGISKRVFNDLLDHLGAKSAQFPGDRALPEVKNYLEAHPPSLGLSMKDITKMGPKERRALGYPGYDAGSKKLAEAFDKSTDQVKVGEFELGSFGRNAGERKVAQKDRFPESELEPTQEHITNTYRASDNPASYRFDNTAHVANMPNGETRVIYTRLNKNNAQEIVNWHKVSDPRYIDKLESFGTPAQGRTGISPLEAGRTGPLSDGSVTTIPQKLDKFEGFSDLTTTVLDDLKGRATVSRQYILDALNRQGVTQAEKGAFTAALDSVSGKTLNAKEFADAVKTQLLPLDTALSENSKILGGGQPRYEGITLPDELRGPVAKYEERVYQSPIKTSGGSVHFNTQDYPNYFAHSRIEDLPGKERPFPKDSEIDDVAATFGDKYYSQGGTTRRVIEIQSDLFQKGRLEGELSDKTMKYGSDSAYNNQRFDARQAEIAKLEPYRNTWHERVIREEVKQAAKDGKTKLQFPTGETAMRVEGLAGEAGHVPEGSSVGDTFEYGGDDYVVLGHDYDGGYRVTPSGNIKRQFSYEEALDEEAAHFADNAKYEMENDGDVSRLEQYLSQEFVDEFKKIYEEGSTEKIANYLAGHEDEILSAAAKDAKSVYPNAEAMVDEFNDMGGEKYYTTPDDTILVLPEDVEYNLETMYAGGGELDIDKDNPIYKFYESDVRKFLQKKYGAKLVTDPQGVSWYEVDVPKEAAEQPIKAFGKAQIGPLIGGAAVGAGATLPFVPSNLEVTDNQPPELPQPKTEVRGVAVTPQDLQTLRDVLFAEVSNRDPQKQQLEARTIVNTVINRIKEYAGRGKKLTLSEVLRQPNQYQGYGSKEYQRVTSGGTRSTDQQKLKAIEAVLSEVQGGALADNTNGAVFYRHNDDGSIQYDDTRRLYK